jgi:TorA maturation chaperone TorD
MDGIYSPGIPAGGAAPPFPDTCRRALADSVQLLADILLQPGWDGREVALQLEGRWAEILKQNPPGAPALPPGGEELRDGLGRLGRSPADELEVEYARLFLHGRPATAHPYESFYRVGQLCDPACLAELGELYEAAGIHPAADGRVAPDHLGLELEFLATLLRALADPGIEEPARSSIRALAAELLQAHLQPFASTFIARLAEMRPAGYFNVAADVLHSAIAFSIQSLGLPVSG